MARILHRFWRAGVVLAGSVGVVLCSCAGGGTGGDAGREESSRSVGRALGATNPVFSGWYADPEGVVFDGRVWIYPTFSAPYDDQVRFDAFSSDDLAAWTKHENVLTSDNVWWARRAMWAPAVVRHRGKYFLFFGANDIQSDREVGGIGVAVADSPAGPFKDYLGRPLIDRFHNGAQPIDQYVFRDADGTHYMFYGGWHHCNVVKLKDDFTGLEAMADGTMYKEITPEGYVEGAFMLRREVGGRARYYLMWSEGGWTGPDYSVAYAVGESVMGPFRRAGTILKQDPNIATGAGHHSVIEFGGRTYIVYHRRPLGEKDRNHRVVCVDRLEFDAEGMIRPVVMTGEETERRRDAETKR